MKKISAVSLASFVFLFLCSSVAVLLRGLDDAPLALGLGVATLAISAIIAIFAKDKTPLNLLCFILSSLAMGALIRSWYIVRGFDNSLGLMTLISLLAVLYLWIFFALSKIPFIHKSKKAYITLAVLYAVISIVLYVVAVIKTETTYVSTLGYYMIIEFAFIFAMSLEVNSPRELLRNLTLSTYSVLGVAIIVGVFVLCAVAGDGDCDCDCLAEGCCEGCDCIDTGDKRKKKK